MVQPALQRPGEEAGRYCVPEVLVLQAYQHHALVRIGQPSNVPESQTRRRTGSAAALPDSSSNPAAATEAADRALQKSKAVASRTYRWLDGLPNNFERLSMSGMQLGMHDAVVLADFLSRRGRQLVELDLKCNQLNRAALDLIFGALKECPKLSGLALAENPLQLGVGGGQGGQKGALGSWIGDALVTCVPRLEKLGLGSTGLSDDDVCELGARLKNSNYLKVLGLSTNPISLAGVEGLLNGIKRGRGQAPASLHTLVLSNCSGLHQGDAASLRALAVPGLSIKF